MIKYTQKEFPELNVAASCGFFRPETGAAEQHVMFEITDTELATVDQFNGIDKALHKFQTSEAAGMTLVWRRYFVSDAANQRDFLPSPKAAAVSVVQQPPLNSARVALWAYFAEGGVLQSTPDGAWAYHRPKYTHLYDLQLHCHQGDSAFQTSQLFNVYNKRLNKYNANWANHCLRTWLFVQNIDVQYQGMVKARRELFAETGLTADTHYITSTGIEGKYISPETLVLMDAYAVPEIKAEQIRYLHGSTHLNPTHEYGVTFERGVCIQYGDRRHIHIAGTASINNRGEIVHPLDAAKQTARALENVGVLLAEAEATFTDIVQMIVYLRDMADYRMVQAAVETACPSVPKVYVQAAVCRPGWLVEVECMAVTDKKSKKFAAF